MIKAKVLLDRDFDIGAVDDRHHLGVSLARLGFRPETDLLDDAQRVLAARVVRRDHHHVAQTRRHHAHQRTFGAIAVAPGTEHRDEPSGREGPGRLQQVPQRVEFPMQISHEIQGTIEQRLHK